MDNIALSLLDELNGTVNGDLIELQEVQNHQKSESLEHSSPKLHDTTSLTGRHKRLSAMLYFLQARPGDRFSLATGPDPPLFTFPPGGYGMKAMGYAKIWRAFLDRLAAEATISQGLQSISLQAMGLSGEELTDDQSGMLERRASVVIDAMFKEFRQLNCADVRTHEIRLRLSGLYTDPAQPILDVFVSSCPNETSENWHEARCGSFPVAIDGAGKQNLCAQGLFNVTDKMPTISSSSANFKSEALIELFRHDLFGQITVEDSLRGMMEKKVGSKQKAGIALMLARCLLDFFDDDIELASHSWAPGQIFFISPSTTTLATRGNIYVSLKPRPCEIKPTDLLGEFRAGNSIRLSFARLLLEIETGKEIPIPIHPETKKFEENWGFLCRFIKEKKDKGESVQYLDAVEGCLHLCNNLPRSKDRPTGSAASKVLRKAIYEKIILKLELITNPQSSKQKRQFSVSEHPQAKKPLIAGLLGGESPGVHTSTTPFYHKQGEQSTTPEQPTHQRAGRFDGRLCESLKAR
ncbi:hypothetical protein B7494_g5906 [Chlorociboria aeruginascens]|nr:hypothetical protein B7494_g5906 [Chlorociboria aeruginascens]